MAIDVRLIVADAPPLITLAVGKSLDYLLYPDLPGADPEVLEDTRRRVEKRA